MLHWYNILVKTLNIGKSQINNYFINYNVPN